MSGDLDRPPDQAELDYIQKYHLSSTVQVSKDSSSTRVKEHYETIHDVVSTVCCHPTIEPIDVLINGEWSSAGTETRKIIEEVLIRFFSRIWSIPIKYEKSFLEKRRTFTILDKRIIRETTIRHRTSVS